MEIGSIIGSIIGLVINAVIAVFVALLRGAMKRIADDLDRRPPLAHAGPDRLLVSKVAGGERFVDNDHARGVRTVVVGLERTASNHGHAHGAEVVGVDDPYSNFVSGYDEQLGFNPIDRYLDFVLQL